MANKKILEPFYAKEIYALEKRGEVITHKSANRLVIGQKIARANNNYIVVVHKLLEVYHHLSDKTYYYTTFIGRTFDGNILSTEEFDKNHDKLIANILNEYKDKYGYDLSLYKPKQKIAYY